MLINNNLFIENFDELCYNIWEKTQYGGMILSRKVIITRDSSSDLSPELVEKYNIKKVWLFGSFVRDDATEYSDVDLYVDFSIDLDELKQQEVKEYFEFIFQRRVDMHIEGKVYERIAPNGKETRELVLDATK